jgi:hypothetical protein
MAPLSKAPTLRDKTIEIAHAERNRRGRYWTDTQGGEAELTYQLDGAGRMVIATTFVPVEARGAGVAEALVRRALADARREGLKVDPACPYVDRLFARHPEWSDLRS